MAISAVADAADYATFESFYRESWFVPWKLAALVGILIGIGVYIVAPPAGPVATAVGTWIGGLFGYSGIAATNFGLALLGGGAVAGGGLGIAGGTAVLAAAFSFSTDVVLDYATHTAVESYKYSDFAASSKEMLTLPPPRNSSGPDVYEDAFKILKSIDGNEPLSSNGNQSIIKRAIEAMETGASASKKLDAEDQARADTLLALLYFQANNYHEARDRANQAVLDAQAAGEDHTLPSFLLAASLLYDEEIDTDAVLEHFEYAIHEEPDNPLAPIAFGVLLDRILWRINNDRALPVTMLDEVAFVGRTPDLDDQFTPVHLAVLSRYLLQLKVEQNWVSSLAMSENEAIRNSPLTLEQVRTAMNNYEILLEGAWFDAGRLAGNIIATYDEFPDELREPWETLQAYSEDRVRLESLAEELVVYQRTLGSNNSGDTESGDDARQPAWKASGVLWALLAAVAGILVGFFAGRRRRPVISSEV